MFAVFSVEDGTGGGRILTSSRIPSSKKTHISKGETRHSLTCLRKTCLLHNGTLVLCSPQNTLSAYNQCFNKDSWSEATKKT